MEEEAKRRTLLRYIHAVKAAASLGLDDESHKNMTAAVGRPGRGIIQVRGGSEGGSSREQETREEKRASVTGRRWLLPCLFQPPLSIGTTLVQGRMHLLFIFYCLGFSSAVHEQRLGKGTMLRYLDACSILILAYSPRPPSPSLLLSRLLAMSHADHDGVMVLAAAAVVVTSVA